MDCYVIWNQNVVCGSRNSGRRSLGSEVVVTPILDRFKALLKERDDDIRIFAAGGGESDGKEVAVALTNISHVRDLSSILTKAVENPDAAGGNIFNCVSDRAVTLDGMAKLCAKAAGLPVDIVHYDPKLIGSDTKILQYALLHGAKSC